MQRPFGKRNDRSMTYNIAILGASGYTGAELTRLILGHPDMTLVALTGERKAGRAMAEVYPFLRGFDLPGLCRIEDVDFSGVDLAFCALPHATSQSVIKGLPRDLKVVDLSADFRLRDPEAYAKWYGKPHDAPELQAEAVYGLTEFYRDQIRTARLVAGTGCNAATGQYAIRPLLAAGVIDPDEIIINLITGVSGAGRSLKENLLHAEMSEGANAYAIGSTHRHLGEFDQEFSAIAGRPVSVQFTPHLAPMNRGILATVYVHGHAQAIYEALEQAYRDEPFIQMLPFGASPSTHDVRGSNYVHVGVAPDRRAGRASVFVALDNLCKGSSGQALQNANLMLGVKETTGLLGAALFP
ncbi:N-acetyl-gamma-glutamyl-phosphate reductase [Roseibacterium beibuensis]|uniref:N-acetyl-gamma-glutamyl-phosphate reductase n=2 Tax=[Roseibacterium] beibuensis TaxID=1193142 RepID=A0ABP9L5W2_9RHOB